jgi:coenzyme PQQ synthesis protein D (PqqD)
MENSPLLGSRIQVNADVLCQDLNGEAVLLNLKTGVYFGLDRVGTRVWQLLESHTVLAQILDVMVAEYDVPKERCAEDLIALVNEMQKQELVTLT